MKQTIAQKIKWDFETNGNLEIKDKNGKLIYFEYSNGVWVKYEYDSQGNQIYYENSNGRWTKSEYDSKGNITHYQNSNGRWTKSEWDSQNKRSYKGILFREI